MNKDAMFIRWLAQYTSLNEQPLSHPCHCYYTQALSHRFTQTQHVCRRCGLYSTGLFFHSAFLATQILIELSSHLQLETACLRFLSPETTMSCPKAFSLPFEVDLLALNPHSSVGTKAWELYPLKEV